MIPVLKNSHFALYEIKLPKNIFPAFVEKYVLHLPVGTRIELMARDWNERLLYIEFVRTETGFLFLGEASNQAAREFMSHYQEGIQTPDEWFDLVVRPCIPPFHSMTVNLAHASVLMHRLKRCQSLPIAFYLEMNHTRHPRTEGKRVITSLLDLPPVK
ncbi:hypothetical protein TNCT_729961 [Trichonephila clavata]|uniref:Uncharacterized protein n=1 Tax=Trichonephila clavata TaxID=2740835 RepID=A0A8X6F2Y2_TRICU|nr:hypothetical protein TNCT_729961 [Trichonephila clavata]